MRGLVALSLVLSLASLSGCVSLVEDGSDPDLEAAAADADRALDEYQAKAGHIAGLVSDSDGQPLSGALVDLVGIQDDLATDDKGRFAFLDLTPGVYTLVVDAADFQTQQASIDVAPGQFSRPNLVLEPVTPEAYTQVFQFEAYQSLGILGAGFGCQCVFEDILDPEGLTVAVLEARSESNQPFFPNDSFRWTLSSWGEDGNTTYADDAYGNYGPAPLYVVFDAADFAPAATNFALEIQPETFVQSSIGQYYEGYLTIFYNGPAPEGYSAYDVEE